MVAYLCRIRGSPVAVVAVRLYLAVRARFASLLGPHHWRHSTVQTIGSLHACLWVAVVRDNMMGMLRGSNLGHQKTGKVRPNSEEGAEEVVKSF